MVTPLSLELWEDGAGTTTRVEDMTNERVSKRLASQVKARVNGKAKETVTIADHQGIT